jgi:hypothetical protein
VTNDERRTIQEECKAREDAIDFLEGEWSTRFDSARFSRASLRMFFRKGLTLHRLYEAIEAVEWKTETTPSLATNAEGAWKYFCGTCWNMLNGTVLVR